MAKKSLLVLVLAALITGGTFAQTQQVQLSAGGGLQLGFAVPTGDWSDWYPNFFNFGFHGFFDATFVEASLSLDWLTGTQDFFGHSFRITMFDLGITVLGKFPIDMGQFTIFPLAGLGFNIPLSGWLDGNRVDREDLLNPNMFLSFGGGADFDLANNIFIRPSLLLNFHFRPIGEDWGYMDTPSALMFVNPKLRVAAGFRF